MRTKVVSLKEKSTIVPFLNLTLDETSSVPLYRQIYTSLRRAVLVGQLAAGAKLPSTRHMATELGVSRNTVLIAFQQLLAEGYLESKAKSGTFVTHSLPDEAFEVPSNKTNDIPDRSTRKRPLSQRSQILTAVPIHSLGKSDRSEAFRPGLPALDAFPLHIWSKLVARRWRHPPRTMLDYGDPAGYRPLRQAIADYLAAVRGVRCEPEQVLVVAGAQQALDLAIRVLLDPRDAVWIEEPGNLTVRCAFLAAGIQLVPVPVDREGLSVAAGMAEGTTPRLIYVSPSHQYPLGMTMSLSRRLELLEWAKHSHAWILEDDYDSEYRFSNRPLEALQGLDKEGCVIYIGTFSKVLFPSLRLGYLIVPSNVVDHFLAARLLTDRHSPIIEQAVLTDFFVDGHFARHIRRMRNLYEQRHELLFDLASQELTDWLELYSARTGLHMVGWLRKCLEDRIVSKQAAQNGVEVPALSQYYLGPAGRGGLLLGYGGVDEQKIKDGVQRLKVSLQNSLLYSSE